MSRIPGVVLGYHGCIEPLASRLLNDELSIADWKASENVWDWLGHGIYFWEGDAQRAFRWALDKAKAHGGTPAVVGALIDLESCFDLTDERFTSLLALAHRQVENEYQSRKLPLPENRGGDDKPRRALDCLVINSALSRMNMFSSVRGPFLEGPPAYPGSMLRSHSHVQIAVRDRSCIIGVFKPNLNR